MTGESILRGPCIRPTERHRGLRFTDRHKGDAALHAVRQAVLQTVPFYGKPVAVTGLFKKRSVAYSLLE